MADITKVNKIQGDVSQGGWTAAGLQVNDGDSISWYQEIEFLYDFYSGSWDPFPRVAFKGHAMPDPLEKTFQTSRLKWSAFTGQEFLKRGEVQGIYFKDDASPSNDHQVNGLTYAAIVAHLLGQSGETGHCNLVAGIWPEGFMTLDIDTTNSSSIDNYLLKSGNFWRRLVEIAQIDEYQIWVGKDNVLHYRPHPMFQASLPTPVLDLDSGMLAEPLTIETRNPETIGQVILSGYTPSGSQITGKYPTYPSPGPVQRKSGYLSSSSAKMNTIAERIFKFNNRTHTVTAIIGNGIGLMMDLMDRVSITYTSSVDGVSWSAKKFWIHQIRVDLDDNFNAQTTLVLEAENA